jgi:hypothetical protein
MNLKSRSERKERLLLSYLELAEERVALAKQEAIESAERAWERSELEDIEDGEDEPLSLRRRLATAMILLGARLDPEAVEAVASKGEAA